MAQTLVTETPHVAPHHEETFWSKYVFPTDHKRIAMQYMFTGIFMAIIGGLMAYVFRMQLAFPGVDVPGFGLVDPGEYNFLVTSHGTIMNSTSRMPPRPSFTSKPSSPAPPARWDRWNLSFSSRMLRTAA